MMCSKLLLSGRRIDVVRWDEPLSWFSLTRFSGREAMIYNPEDGEDIKYRQ